MKQVSLPIILFYASMACSFPAYTQQSTIDSLKKVLQTQKEDTNKINTLNDLSRIYTIGQNANYSNVMQYAKDALSLSEKLNFASGKGNAYHHIGDAFAMQQNFSSALNNYYSALSIDEEMQNKQYMADVYENIGSTFLDQGNYSEAIKNLQVALKLREEVGDSNGIAQTLNSIGRVYLFNGDYTGALQKHFAALKICEALGNKAANWSIPYCYGSIANVYRIQADQTSKTNDKINPTDKYLSALKYYFLTLKEWEAIGRKDGLAITDIHIGNIYVRLGKFSTAKDCFQKGIRLSKETMYREYLQYGYLSLSKLDRIQGNYKQAYEHYKMHILYRDSIFNEESTRKSLQAQMQYEFDKKESLTKASQEKKDVITTSEIQNEKTIRNFSFTGTFAVLGFACYGFYRYRRKKRIQSQQAMMNERLRISRELHDEVGATLSGIAMYSHLTKEQIRSNQMAQVEKSLNIMQQSSGEMVNKLNDIVWLINPERDSLQKLIERLEEYARDMAAIKNMQVKITMPVKIAELSLPVECRRNIYLLCKEAINNAVKYSGATLIQIDVYEHDHLIEFAVKDNGKGFDQDTIKKGNGLENMQKRADEIGARLLLRSKLNEGVLVSLQYKIT